MDDDAAAGHPAFRGGTSIFATMSAAAARHGAVNLGQGYPDSDGPPSLKRAAADHLLAEPQQYAPVGGLPLLKSALAVAAATDARVAVDPDAGVVVTAGATEALAAAILGVVRPGDEVVVVDPCYDSYAPLVRAAGGAVVPLALDPAKGWALPSAAAVAATFSARTRALVLNTPHNPTGKVFTAAELGVLAGAMVAAGSPSCVAILDEVYEYLTFPGAAHVSLATLPGMADRCIRVGSAGKTFSMTGWKVGWALSSSPALLAAVLRAHQFLTFSVPPALQAGVAAGFAEEREFVASHGPTLAAKRASFAAALDACGFRVLPGEGTYFIVADAAGLMRPGEDDAAFCDRVCAEAKVAAIPVSAFYLSPDPPKTLVRFAYYKADAVLEDAAAKLGAYFGVGGAGAAWRIDRQEAAA